MDSSIAQYITYGGLLLLAIGLVYIYFTYSKKISELQEITNNHSRFLAKLVMREERPRNPPKGEEIEKALDEFPDDQMTEKTFKDD